MESRKKQTGGTKNNDDKSTKHKGQRSADRMLSEVRESDGEGERQRKWWGEQGCDRRYSSPGICKLGNPELCLSRLWRDTLLLAQTDTMTHTHTHTLPANLRASELDSLQPNGLEMRRTAGWQSGSPCPPVTLCKIDIRLAQQAARCNRLSSLSTTSAIRAEISLNQD